MAARIDTQNPFIYYAIFASGLAFLALSFFAIIALSLLIAVGFYQFESVHILPVMGVGASMLGLGIWNLISSARLLDDVNPVRLAFITLRSLLALAPAMLYFGMIIWR